MLLEPNDFKESDKHTMGVFIALTIDSQGELCISLDKYGPLDVVVRAWWTTAGENFIAVFCENTQRLADHEKCLWG